MRVKGCSGEAESAGEELDLPARNCELCGEYQWSRNIARYDLSIPDGVDPSILRVSTGWRELSMIEFDALVEAFHLPSNDERKLIPGMKIGHPTLHLTTAPKDFVFDGLVPLISEKALECIRACAIKIDVSPVDLIGRGNKRHRYFNILTPVLRLMDEQWMSLERVKCPKCEEWWKKPGIRLPKIVLVSKAHAVKSRWPNGQGIVYSEDIGGVYYSPEFVQACQDADLTGIGFEQVFWV